MEVQPVDILLEVDKVFDAGTPDDEIRLARENVRRYLKGTVPSVTIRHLVISSEKKRRDPLQEKVDQLQRQVTELELEKTELEAQINRLRDQVRQTEGNYLYFEPAVDGFYTMEQFMAVLMRRLRRSYGWRTDYVMASHYSPTCTAVENETIQKWKNLDRVPEWAVEQIERMNFRERTGTSGVHWSKEDEAYLAEIYQEDPMQSNATLADRCGGVFGRPISENAIKGALDRQRKRGQLAKKRPGRGKL